MLKKSLAICLISCLLAPLHAVITVDMIGNGNCKIIKDGVTVGNISAGYFLPGWQNRNYGRSVGLEIKNNTVDCMGGLESDPVHVNMKLNFKPVGKNAIHFAYSFTPKADLEAMTLYAYFSLNDSVIQNRDFFSDGKKAGTVPEKLTKSIHLFKEKTKTFTIQSAVGPFTLEFPQARHILFQDNRKWGNEVGIRIASHSETPTIWKGGVPHRVEYTLTFPEDIELLKNNPFTLVANDQWIPLNIPSLEIIEGSALDFSNITKLDAPAGKHGWTKAVGPNFEFENMPGVPQRFYGVNFCFSAHNITPEQSKILAKRLARLGYNAVRYHHHERNICNKKIPGDSTQFDKEKMAQFDAMFAAMKAEGLYATTDLYVSRDVYESEVIKGGNPKKIVKMQIYKRLCAFSPMALENWKKFAANFLNHVNPHTGLSYAKDPSLNLISLINEGPIDSYGTLRKTGYDPLLREAFLNAWNDWLLKKYGGAIQRNTAWNADCDNLLDIITPDNNPVAERDLQQFFAETEINMINEMKRFLREDLGCKALISDINCAGKAIWAQMARSNMDYVDDHFYVDHPSFVQKAWQLPLRCKNISIVSTGKPGGSGNIFARIIDKPFTITEWNYAGPGRYRGAGGILTGCLASIQNWSGLWRFAYSHGKDMFIPNRPSGSLNLVADPLGQASERAMMLLYLRQDIKPAPKTIVASIDSNHFQDARNNPKLRTIPDWTSLCLLAQMGTYVGDSKATVPQADITVSYSANAPKAKLALTDHENATTPEATQQLFSLVKKQNWLPENNTSNLTKKRTQTIDGQFTIDGDADIMVLNTPRTAGGFAHPGKTIQTDSATFAIHDTDATIWVSSLEDAPIKSAKRLLITHLTDLQNTGQRYNERTRSVVLRWGKTPHLVRAGRADVTLKLNNPEKATVWAIDTCGKRLEKYPAKVTPEGLKLTLSVKGNHGAQMLYEVVVD